MKHYLFKSILLVSFFSLTSCSYYTYYLQSGASTYQPTDFNNIKIFSGDKADKEYEIIGSVAADVYGTSDKAVKILKKKSAKIGADAIIHTQLNLMFTTKDRTGITGIAVKYK